MLPPPISAKKEAKETAKNVFYNSNAEQFSNVIMPALVGFSGQIANAGGLTGPIPPIPGDPGQDAVGAAITPATVAAQEAQGELAKQVAMPAPQVSVPKGAGTTEPDVGVVSNIVPEKTNVEGSIKAEGKGIGGRKDISAEFDSPPATKGTWQRLKDMLSDPGGESVGAFLSDPGVVQAFVFGIGALNSRGTPGDAFASGIGAVGEMAKVSRDRQQTEKKNQLEIEGAQLQRDRLEFDRSAAEAALTETQRSTKMREAFSGKDLRRLELANVREISLEQQKLQTERENINALLQNQAMDSKVRNLLTRAGQQNDFMRAVGDIALKRQELGQTAGWMTAQINKWKKEHGLAEVVAYYDLWKTAGMMSLKEAEINVETEKNAQAVDYTKSKVLGSLMDAWGIDSQQRLMQEKPLIDFPTFLQQSSGDLTKSLPWLRTYLQTIPEEELEKKIATTDPNSQPGIIARGIKALLGVFRGGGGTSAKAEAKEQLFISKEFFDASKLKVGDVVPHGKVKYTVGKLTEDGYELIPAIQKGKLPTPKVEKSTSKVTKAPSPILRESELEEDIGSQ